jgi:glycosyltransferase involved in cell wall biosynthesis
MGFQIERLAFTETGAISCGERMNSESRQLRAIQVVAGLNPADGGPSITVPRLNNALRVAGIDSHVFTIVDPRAVGFQTPDWVRSFPLDFGHVPRMSKLYFSRALSTELKGEAPLDLIHSHGLWRVPNISAARVARSRLIPSIVSPRGMLSDFAWRASRRSKAIFWALAQKDALSVPQCLHATSTSEFEEIRRAGLRQPVVVIPNGVDLPEVPEPCSGIAAWQQTNRKTLLYLGRVHPKKGLDTLVAAWNQVAAEFPEWELRIVGPGEDAHLAELHGMIQRLGVRRISLEAPVYGEAKWEVFKNTRIFILPTINENFGMTVAESLACGRPVIVSKGAPWRGVEENGCGWWIDFGKESIVAALRIALTTPDEVLEQMGRCGRAWMKAEFQWDGIGQQMAAVYRWLCGTGPRPAGVLPD